MFHNTLNKLSCRIPCSVCQHSIEFICLDSHYLPNENTLPTLELELEQTDYAPDAVDHFLGVCAGWLIGHTLTEDLAITGKQIR